MKKFGILLSVLLLLGLTACGFSSDDKEAVKPVFVITEPAEPTAVYFNNAIPSQYIDGAQNSFDRDALEHLFVFSAFGNGDILMRWNEPIRYALCGNFSPVDVQTAREVAERLSSIPGFPGISETKETDANVCITVTDVSAADAHITANSAGQIHHAQITVPASGRFNRSDAIRTSLFRICGLLYQTETTLDTVNTETYPASAPTDTDWMLMELLYGDMQSGMTKDECRTTFREHFTAQ